MSKLDELKEEVNWLGRWLTAFIVTMFALVGWLALNYKTAEEFPFYAATIGVAFFAIAIYLINRSAIKKIRQMKELKK
ncbi:MAG: hypothetical protein PHI47_02490 [Sulfuricurvum sp.]|uniref:hypothetical protein n=1 Tax=Sulfuricurvum sp. TaxID=2025608 RepID=UPI00261AB30A|nr:hypothetical protein [Sulfuricurvum sp.]MDD5158894.1 hypothetical protein [Sulfuricurvum sp.]